MSTVMPGMNQHQPHTNTETLTGMLEGLTIALGDTRSSGVKGRDSMFLIRSVFAISLTTIP